jgi:AcrR family transcriptional regulator
LDFFTVLDGERLENSEYRTQNVRLKRALEISVSQPILEHGEPSETRAKLLDAAERLFAERGFEATSVRDITADAGCNVAAVNYHFGGKERLYLETFRQLLGELRDRRVQRIRADMDAAGDGATLELFLESMANAFLEPLTDADRGRLLTTMISRELMDHRLPPNVFVSEFIRPVLDVAREQLRKVGPPLDDMTSSLCLMSLVGQLLHVLKAGEMLAEGGAGEIVPNDLADHVAHIVRFSAAGIRGCATGAAGSDSALAHGS